MRSQSDGLKTTEWCTNKIGCTIKHHVTDLEHIEDYRIVVIYQIKRKGIVFIILCCLQIMTLLCYYNNYYYV